MKPLVVWLEASALKSRSSRDFSVQFIRLHEVSTTVTKAEQNSCNFSLKSADQKDFANRNEVSLLTLYALVSQLLQRCDI